MTKAVVVGAGGISRAWIPPLKQENVEVAAIVDLDLERARAAREKYELGETNVSDDLEETLRTVKPDFVVDLTVPAAHCHVTCTALEAGCHVVGEKPMAASMDEARRMVKTAERTGKLYMVSQSRRWDRLNATVAETVRNGEVGRVTQATCEFFLGVHFGGFREEMASPLILDMAIHHFDLARMFIGDNPAAVYAHEFNPVGSWYRGDVAASCVFELAGGGVFTYTGSWCSTGCDTSWHGNWRVLGDQGTLRFENDGEPYGEKAGAEPVTKGATSQSLQPVDIAQVDMPFPGQHGAIHELLRYLDTGELPQGECHDNIHSVAMVFAAIESAAKKVRVPIEA